MRIHERWRRARGSRNWGNWSLVRPPEVRRRRGHAPDALRKRSAGKVLGCQEHLRRPIQTGTEQARPFSKMLGRRGPGVARAEAVGVLTPTGPQPMRTKLPASNLADGGRPAARAMPPRPTAVRATKVRRAAAEGQRSSTSAANRQGTCPSARLSLRPDVDPRRSPSCPTCQSLPDEEKHQRAATAEQPVSASTGFPGAPPGIPGVAQCAWKHRRACGWQVRQDMPLEATRHRQRTGSHGRAWAARAGADSWRRPHVRGVTRGSTDPAVCEPIRRRPQLVCPALAMPSPRVSPWGKTGMCADLVQPSRGELDPPVSAPSPAAQRRWTTCRADSWAARPQRPACRDPMCGTVPKPWRRRSPINHTSAP